MLSHQTKAAVAGAWILTAGLIGVLGNVTSMGAGVLVLGCALIPPLVLMLPGWSPVPVHNRRSRR
jgi:hypothetical protein